MLTLDFNDELGSRWREVFRSIFNAVRKDITARAFTKPSAFDSWEDDPKLYQAMLTVRMAANPGEDYDVVAARIEKEADNYEKFLLNPTPIGKFALNVKQFPAEEEDDEGVFTCPMYQVSEPAEGRASVFYTFNRSNRLVLEFFIYDDHDNLLFPIVRTYSDWIGKKKFDLGLGRMFHLDMAETESSDFVMVRAGFMPFPRQEVHAPQVVAKPVVEPVAARGVNNDELKYPRRGYAPAFGRRLAFACGVPSMVVVFLFCGALFARTVSPPQPAPLHAASSSALGSTTLITRASPEEFAEQSDAQVTYEEIAEPLTDKNDDHNPASLSSSSSGKSHLPPNRLQKAERIVAIKRLGIMVDASACHETESRCNKMLAGFQKAIETRLSHLNLPVHSFSQTEHGQGSGRLVVSYEPEEDGLGRIYVTLYDLNGLLWTERDNCYEYGDTQAEIFVSTSSETFSRQLAREIKSAKETINSEGKEKRPEPAQKGEASSITE